LAATSPDIHFVALATSLPKTPQTPALAKTRSNFGCSRPKGMFAYLVPKTQRAFIGHFRSAPIFLRNRTGKKHPFS